MKFTVEDDGEGKEQEEVEEEDEEDYTQKTCAACGETVSCGNYNEDNEFICECCGEDE
jgi:transposase